MKFAFLVHPLGNETDRVLAFVREVDLQHSFGWDISRFLGDLHVAMARAAKAAEDGAGREEARRAAMIDELLGLRSVLGAKADGRLYEIPMTALAILENPDRAIGHMLEAVEMAADWGARVLGLGSMTGIVGGQGCYLAERAPIPVTTGNSLTAYAAVRNLEHACRDLGIDLGEETVAVIGVPGSIATLAARMLRPQCRSMLLVARQPSPRSTALATELEGELSTDIRTALTRARVVLSATSSGGCIEQRWLLPGTVLSDVGVPTDTIGARIERRDVLILSGGLCKVPGTMPRTSHYLWFHNGTMAACLAETVVLALDESPESLSLGRNLDLGRTLHIGQRAEAHGFDFARQFSLGQPLDDGVLSAYRKALVRQRHAAQNHHHGSPLAGQGEVLSAARLGPRAVERFERHMNPAMRATFGGLTRCFVKGAGSRVWDAQGRSYLDFLAGYGSLNLGHNHPAVVQATQAVLAEGAPGFSPAAVNPWAAALAEQLAAVAPEGLEMAFFANSGAEAVEAALKLARRATGRSGFLHCERSYHGKTLGALSVTGNRQYQGPFEPLLAHCEAVPFGDARLLERALESGRFAAFLVEPIQGEGGMIVPPEGYLRQAEALCRQTGTLLVADEVQTGLGRTGRLFAVDGLGVRPDLMTLAKSLGGGLLPIGALLARRDLWRKAYGRTDTFALHTSTFGGGSLASAAGLATLRVLGETDLLANVEARGRQLRSGLEALASRHPLVREVRGQGLMLGIEFEPPPRAIVGQWRNLLADGVGTYLVPGLDDFLEALTATYVMTLLLQEHGIYTQVARSNPRVLRVEPPLILTEDEARQFLEAMGACLGEVARSMTTFEQMIAKSILGQHGDEGTAVPRSGI